MRTRDLQSETGGFTEFVPLPFVHMATPIFFKGRARRGPTFREAVLMHAVARLHYATLIDNIQVSWVKMGVEGSRRILQAGANDLGGTLMDENISRAAGATHGQEMDVDTLRALVEPLGRPLHPAQHPLSDVVAVDDLIERSSTTLRRDSPLTDERIEVLRGSARALRGAGDGRRTTSATCASRSRRSTSCSKPRRSSRAWRDVPRSRSSVRRAPTRRHPLYEMARELGAAMAERGWMTISGAGPGIMEASAKGAGREHTLGVNIELPFEQCANPYIDAETMLVAMKYFFTRKVAMTRPSNAFAVFPGGLGTMDETFEVLTLLHTGKTSPAPVVLVDTPGRHLLAPVAATSSITRSSPTTTSTSSTCASCASAPPSTTAVGEIEHFFSNYVRFDVRGDRGYDPGPAPPDRRATRDARDDRAALRRTVRVSSLEDDATISFDFDGRNYVNLRLLIDRDQRLGPSRRSRHASSISAFCRLRRTLDRRRSSSLASSAPSARSCARTVSKMTSETRRLEGGHLVGQSRRRTPLVERLERRVRPRRTGRAAPSCRTCRRWSWERSR